MKYNKLKISYFKLQLPKMTQSLSITILCLMLNLYFTTSLSSVPVFVPSDVYCQAGTYNVDTSPYYMNPNADDNSIYSYYVPLSRNHTTYFAVGSITGVNYISAATKKIDITTYVYSYAPGGITFSLVSQKLSGLEKLQVRFLVLDLSLANKINCFTKGIYFFDNYGYTPLSSSTPIVAKFTVSAINTVGTGKALVAFNGMNVSCTDSTYSIDIKLTASYQNSTTIKVDITSALSTVLNVSSVAMSIIGYNVEQSMAWPFPAVTIKEATFYTNAPWIDNNNTFGAKNTFWGMKYVKSKNKSNFTISSSFSVNTSVTGISDVSTVEWQGVVLLLKFCDANTVPYYMKTQDKCYDNCPDLYYQDTTDMLCKNCTSFDCLKCSANGSCTTCDPTRALNSATGKCDPLAGYFESGALVASDCNASCMTCILNANKCTSCFTSYYLSNNQCFACNSNCYTCSTISTNCTGCYPSFFKSSTQCIACISNCNVCNNSATCQTCNTGYMTDASNLCIISYNCAIIASCATCTAPTGCTACSTGYQLQNITSCISVCGDGKRSPLQQCDDNNINNNDGCSSTCMIQSAYFCTGSLGNESTCATCSQYCLNCSSLASCSLCQTFYKWNSGNQSCIPNCTYVANCVSCVVSNTSVECTTCQAGYRVASTNCEAICGDGLIVGNQECDDNNTSPPDGCSSVCTIQDGFACTVVSTKSVCTQCVGATYQSANKTVCLNCVHYDCATCNINGDCLTCSNTSNRYYDNVTRRCINKNGFYDDGSHQTALTCNSLCLTCNGGGTNSCLSCNVGYVLIVNTCKLCTVAIGPHCNTCNKNSSNAVVCDTCDIGYIIVNNFCIFACGDGLVNNGEECDDTNLFSGDGCASNCTIQDSFACPITNSVSICVKCVGATFQAADKRACIKCANYQCATCNIAGDCLSCSSVSHRYLDNNTLRCLPIDGYYNFGTFQMTFLCDSQCLACDDAGNTSCLTCSPNLILVENSCLTCSAAAGQGCTNCTNNGNKPVCLACPAGTIQNGLCVVRIKKQTSNTSLILMILCILAGILLLCCCLMLFCLWRRRKNQQNKVEQEVEAQGEEQVAKTEINNNKLNQTMSIFNKEQPNNLNDEKELNKRRSKYKKSTQNGFLKTRKVLRGTLQQQTEENQLSLEEFKNILDQKQKNYKKEIENTKQKIINNSNNKTTNEHLELKKTKSNTIMDDEPIPNIQIFTPSPETYQDDGSKKSQIQNEDQLKAKMRKDSNDKTKEGDDGEKSEINNQQKTKTKMKMTQHLSDGDSSQKSDEDQETSEKGR